MGNHHDWFFSCVSVDVLWCASVGSSEVWESGTTDDFLTQIQPLVSFSITNLSKQIPFTPFVMIFVHVLFFLSIWICAYLQLSHIFHSNKVSCTIAKFFFFIKTSIFEINFKVSTIFLSITNKLLDLFIALSVPSTTVTEVPDDDDDDDFDDSEESAEADDDSRIYKNPRNSPSSDCPRDEEQATLLGQKCLRKCSSHEDCKSKKKKCLCDGACGMSCIKPGNNLLYNFIHNFWIWVLFMCS